MARRLLKDTLIITAGTLLLLLLCATVGISHSTPPSAPVAKAAQDGDVVVEDGGWVSDGTWGYELEKGAQPRYEP
jgi:hypothetical protein